MIASPSRPARSPRASAPRGDRFFAGWAKATAASAFFLLFAGGMVTSTGSGLAVPDWPLSYGTLNPPMVGGIFFEHGHRLIAGAVALMALVLAVLARRPGVPASARKLAWTAAGLILVQALLGGLTVLMRLPPAVSISHACLGQGVFCLLLAAAALAVPAAPASAPRVVRLAALGFAAAYLQLALGAMIRHTGLGLAAHVLWAFAVVVAAAFAAFTAFRSGPKALAPYASLLSFAIPLQLGLGLFALRVRVDSALILGFREAAVWRTLHLSGGALVLASFLLLALRAREAEAA